MAKYASEQEKMAAFDALPPEQQTTELGKFKDKLKAIAFKDAYDKWKENRFLPEPSQGQAAAMGAAQGATRGFDDNIFAGLMTAIKAPQLARASAMQGKDMLGESYDHDIEKYRKIGIRAEEAFPKTAMASEIVAGAVTAPPALSAGTRSAKLAALLGETLAEGYVSGVGKSNKDFDSREGLAAGVLGADMAVASLPVGFGIGKAVSKGVSYLGSKAGRGAALQAFKAAHPTLADLREIDEERAVQIGKRLLDEKVVRPWNSAEGIAEKTGKKRQEIGAQIGEKDAKLDELLSGDELPRDQIAIRIIDDAKEAYPTRADRELRGMLEGEAETFLDGAPVRFKELRAEKSANYRKGYETQDFQPTRRAEAFRHLAHSQGKQYDEFAEQVSPELATDVKDLSKRFADFSEADEMASVAAARERKSGSLPLSDIVAAGGATAMGGPFMGAAALGAKKVLESRVHSINSSALNNIAALAGKKSGAGAIAKLMLKSPEKLEKFLPDLVKAASQSEAALEAVANDLAGFPDF
jgi:hypothetical protein